MVSPEEEFSRYHDKLRSELNIVDWHFTVLNYIGEVQNNYLKELNQAPAFWSLTINAHLYTALTRLNRFFERRERVNHLHMNSFLDFIEQNLDIFSHQAFEKRLRKLDRYNEPAEKFNSMVTAEKVEQDRQKIRNLPLSGLRGWRNIILAHIDKEYVVQKLDVEKEHPIKIKHIEQIINTLDEMLNEYCLAYDFSTHIRGLPIQHGLQYILDAIKFKLQSEFSGPTL